MPLLPRNERRKASLFGAGCISLFFLPLTSASGCWHRSTPYSLLASEPAEGAALFLLFFSPFFSSFLFPFLFSFLFPFSFPLFFPLFFPFFSPFLFLFSFPLFFSSFFPSFLSSFLFPLFSVGHGHWNGETWTRIPREGNVYFRVKTSQTTRWGGGTMPFNSDHYRRRRR